MTSIGERLASVRKRRGLNQRELASESGVSVSLIRLLEQGQQETTRLETVRKLATALRVPTSSLVPTPADVVAEADAVEEWSAVRRALEGRRTGPEPDEAPTFDGVTATFKAYKPLLRGGTFAELRAGLPALLIDADFLVNNAGSSEKVEARKLRSRIREMTGWLMTQTWQLDTADLAIELALDDAPDVRRAVAVIDCLCWRYLRQGDFESARREAAKWADDIEPIRISRAQDEDLAGWGLVLLRASSAAIRDNRPGEAEDALRLANVAAMGLRRGELMDSDSGSLRTFGPMTVSMIEAENAIVVDRPQVTLATAARLDGGRYPLPWKWNRHRLDVAKAHASMKQSAEAVSVLRQVRRELPEWLVNQRYGCDILSKVVEKRRTLTPEMRDLADFLKVPY